MALRLTLKPNERVIIGGAVIRNGDNRVEFLIENEIPILRESDILSPTAVRTPCERIYLALQLIYVDPDRVSQHRATFRALVSDVRQAAPSTNPYLEKIEGLVEAGSLYQAIKTAQSLLKYERKLMANAV
jgi:flagellar protein FlbT